MDLFMIDASRGRIAHFVVESTRWFARLWRAERGAIAPMTALMIIPIVGAISMALEMGGMVYVHRSMQNAADAAALAAAANNNDSGVGTTYLMEARAAARPFGYIDGEDDVTVNAEKLATCPTGTPGVNPVCYQANITSLFPVVFGRLVGYDGNEGNGSSQRVAALAVAVVAGSGGGSSEDVCVWTLSTGTTSFTSNGGPRPDMAGCTLYSSGGMTCNGHDLGADYGAAAGTSTGCGAEQVSNVDPPADTYGSLASNIPANSYSSCGGTFTQLTKSGNKWSTTNATNRWTGNKALTGNQTFCGDVQLTGDTTLTGNETTIIIQNGRLDLNGHKLMTASGKAATIVFSGDNNSTYKHYPTSLSGGGTLEIKAPDKNSTSPWKGIAMYQNPSLSTNVDISYSGNDPAWNITGLVYLPKSNVTFSGVVNKAGNGSSCFIIVSYTMLVNGTAQMFANTQCDDAGVTPPEVVIGSAREKLVQ